MVHDKGLVFCASAAGHDIACQICGQLEFALANTKGDAQLGKGSEFANRLREAFSAEIPIIGVCSAGILIRILSPIVARKVSEPPVVCVAPDGSTAFALLGGHRGANRLTKRVADALGSGAAITTASETRLGVALDEPPSDWKLEDSTPMKSTASALLSGAQVRISGRAKWLEPLRELSNVCWTADSSEQVPVVVHAVGSEPLIYRRRELALGVGCVRSCAGSELIALVNRSLADAGLAACSVECVYSIDLKSDEAAIHELAANLGVPARFFSVDTLKAEEDRLPTRSEAVFREVGVHGVCESAALAAAGRNGHLILSKQKSKNATCAVAKIAAGERQHGQPRGKLMIIGLGPGLTDWRTAEANRMIASADAIVGYSGYIQQLSPLAHGRKIYEFSLGEEELRCRTALELAGDGQKIALVSSGDAGIYAMASLVFELLAKGDAEEGVSIKAKRVKIICAPGVSAMQAASSRAGAILGHDFCAVSLSDLLTPKETILRRIRAAAEGDFVVALYNPVSSQRRTLLEKARDLLLLHRSADTPVMLARNVGRDEESLSVIRLEDLKTNAVDMLTTVIVGSTSTRTFCSRDSAAGADGCFVYTPRGYSGSKARSS